MDIEQNNETPRQDPGSVDVEQQNNETPHQGFGGESLPPTSVEQPLIEEVKTLKEAEKDLTVFEKRSLNLNMVLLIVGFLALLVYGGQLFVMQGQLKEAINASNLAREATVLSQRPWLGMESAVVVRIKHGVKLPNGNSFDYWGIKWAVKNYGNSPALSSVIATDNAAAIEARKYISKS